MNRNDKVRIKRGDFYFGESYAHIGVIKTILCGRFVVEYDDKFGWFTEDQIEKVDE